jgi:hypothetical protein
LEGGKNADGGLLREVSAIEGEAGERVGGVAADAVLVQARTRLAPMKTTAPRRKPSAPLLKRICGDYIAPHPELAGGEWIIKSLMK